MRKIAIVIGLMWLCGAQAGSLYRWVDKDGKVHYGDKPDEDAVVAEQKRFSEAAATEGDLPYSTRKARQDFPVALYVSSSCGDACVQARNFLNKRGIPFAEKNVATNEEIEALKKATGSNSVPTLTIGKTPLIGFDAVQWGSELDLAGYPKSAPFGMRPQLPVAPAAPKAKTPPATVQ